MKQSSAKSRPPLKRTRGQKINPRTTQPKLLQANFQGGVERVSLNVRNAQEIPSQPFSRYSLLRMQNAHYKEELMVRLLSKMLERRKRYSFQVIKQFYLFPDQTISENLSIDSYDRLFFTDENIHTIVKIYETKELEAKIWAFLNLKALRLKQQLEQFSAKIEQIQQSKIKTYKNVGFDNIRQYSIRIKNKEEAAQKANKLVQAVSMEIQGRPIQKPLRSRGRQGSIAEPPILQNSQLKQNKKQHQTQNNQNIQEKKNEKNIVLKEENTDPSGSLPSKSNLQPPKELITQKPKGQESAAAQKPIQEKTQPGIKSQTKNSQVPEVPKVHSGLHNRSRTITEQRQQRIQRVQKDFLTSLKEEHQRRHEKQFTSYSDGVRTAEVIYRGRQTEKAPTTVQVSQPSQPAKVIRIPYTSRLAAAEPRTSYTGSNIKVIYAGATHSPYDQLSRVVQTKNYERPATEIRKTHQIVHPYARVDSVPTKAYGQSCNNYHTCCHSRFQNPLVNTVQGNCTINFNCCHSSANQSRDGNSSRQDSQNLMRSRQLTPKRNKNGREYEDPYDIEERIKKLPQQNRQQQQKQLPKPSLRAELLRKGRYLSYQPQT